MPQSLASNLIHLIYSTKDRRPILTPAIRPSLFAYKAGILRDWESHALSIGGESDHVHILFALNKNYALKKIVEEVKKSSSKWMKTQAPPSPAFSWQNGYAAFSVSQSLAPKIKKYIESQEEHHRELSFKEELRRFLERHNIEYDERYLWD